MHCISEYDVKLLMAFNESLKGKRIFTEILLKGGFPELAALSGAILSDTDAWKWLMNNGYPEFAALSDAIDDEDGAIAWLKQYNLNFMSTFSAACRQEKDAIQWFADNDLLVFIMLIRTIHDVLRFQSWDSSDIHRQRRS